MQGAKGLRVIVSIQGHLGVQGPISTTGVQGTMVPKVLLENNVIGVKIASRLNSQD